MRHCYLVCYDISCPKRLRQINRLLKGYGEAWQFSIFFCSVKALQRVRMEADLRAAMHDKEDKIMIINLGLDEKQRKKAITVLGRALPKREKGTIVI